MASLPLAPAASAHVPAAAALGTSASLCAVAAAAFWGAAPSTVLLTLAAAFLPYGLLLAHPPPSPRRALALALAGAGAAGVALVLAPPTLSDDLYRYLWDARVLAHGVDPYRYAPDDPALAHLRDAAWARVNHPEVPTIYPPVAQLLFGLASAVAHEPWTLKATALLAHLGTVVVVHLLAPPERRGFATVAYGLNPLALAESALAGHVDAVVGLAIAAAALALVTRRFVLGGLALAVATGVKLVGLALLPLLSRRRAALVVSAALGLAMVVPLVGAGEGSQRTGGLGQYARRWRGNEGPFAVLAAATEGAVRGYGRLTDAPPGRVRFPALRGALEAARGTALDPRASLVSEKKEVPDLVEFDARTVSELASRALVLGAILFLALGLARARVPPVAAARWILLAGLLLAPQVHPWYLLWLLPLEAAEGRLPALAWSATCLVAYAPLERWQLERVWLEPAAARVLEYGVVLALLLLEARTQGFRASGVDPLRAPIAPLQGR